VIAIEVENVSKQFRLRTVQPHTTLKTAFVELVLGRRRPRREPVLHALKGVSFAVEQGRTLGIIGRNGSGKSTLLKLLAGILQPDSGRIRVNGRVASLLELGAGFHPEFSGRENIFINGIVLGLSKKEVRRRFNDIVRFAELEPFIDEPVRTYSSGMYMRLGFSVAVHTDPDILLIDEILAVGDEAFQKKCYEKIAEFQRLGKTIVLVTHDLDAVERWCHEALWLDGGTIRGQGMPRKVTDLYRQEMAEREGQALLEEHHRVQGEGQGPALVEAGNRWGSREVEITSVRMLDAAGEERYIYRSGEGATVVVHYRVNKPVDEPVFGIAILRGDGLWCYGSNTEIEGIFIPPLGEEGIVEVLLERLDFIEGTYYLDVAVHAKDGYPYDYQSRLYSFAVNSEIKDVGVFRIPHRWTIRPGESP